MSSLRSVALALLVVLTCVAYVPVRGARVGATLVGDSLSYVAMIRGDDLVESPFRFRLVVPMLARLLPLPPAQALAVLSWLALAAVYALLLSSARRLGVSTWPALGGLVLAVCTPTHLYNYHNPYLTDAAGLLVVTVCTYALLARRFVLFAAASVVGMGVREALLAIAPSWSATGQRGRAALVLALALLTYVALLVSIGPAPLGLNEKPFVFPPRPPLEIAAEALLSWHALWLLAGVGLVRLSVQRRELLSLGGCLLAACLLTSLLASDTLRMFQPLFPVVVLGVGAFVQRAWQCSRGVTLSVLVSHVGSSWLWQPVRFVALPAHHLVYEWGRALALLVMVATACLAVRRVAQAEPPRAAA
jgi:hypothetical protein